MAIAEAITNLLAAPIELNRVKLSANWMAACGEAGEDAALYDTVHAVGIELCPALGISIPVGKDSLSMRTQWKQDGKDHKVTSPVSLIVSAFASLTDVRQTLTPQLNAHEETTLVLVQLGLGSRRMGGSVLGQVLKPVWRPCSRLRQPARSGTAGESHQPTQIMKTKFWPTTIAVMAVCWPPYAKWPLLAK
jgi:phosphoribosylformylglycinamidine synthase